MTSSQSISDAVAQLYDTYPFPPEPLLDVPPPGYNWRWHWQAAYSFCRGLKPQRQDVRILDAGCGTGVGTEYLAHLNPQAEVVGIDLSGAAIATAKERCRRSGATQAQFHQLSLYDAEQLPGSFDWINCVGVLHHLPNPQRGIQALARQLAPGGIFHIFVYAAHGRWEITQMQHAIALLQQERRGDYRDGVHLGRQLFAHLPDNNRLKRREQERWSLENQRDECFADMYVHPQEVDYTLESLFELIQSSGLAFVGFSNPQIWQPERLLGESPELMARVQTLTEIDRYRLIERLDPDITHFEFFLAKPPTPEQPWKRQDWSDLNALNEAIPERHPCIEGWPSRSIFDANYQIVSLDQAEYDFLQACEPPRTVADILTQVDLSPEAVRHLWQRQLILLSRDLPRDDH